MKLPRNIIELKVKHLIESARNTFELAYELQALVDPSKLPDKEEIDTEIAEMKQKLEEDIEEYYKEENI